MSWNSNSYPRKSQALSVTLVLIAVSLLAVLSPSMPGADAVESVLATIAVSQPEGVAVNPNTNRVYVANSFSKSLSVIDGSTNQVVATIYVRGRADAVAVNPNTNRVYVTSSESFGEYAVYVIDGSTSRVLAIIPVGIGPEGIAVNPITNRIYVVHFADPVYVIDGSTNKVVGEIPYDGTMWGVAVNPNTNKVYLANYVSDTVSVADGSTNKIVAKFPVGDGPRGIAVNLRTNMVYVGNHGSGTLSVIDGSMDKVIDTIKVLGGAMGVAVSINTNRVYVTNSGSSSGPVAVIDGSTNQIVATIPVGNNPRGVAVNTNTNRVYVANYGSNTVSVLAEVPFDFGISVSPSSLNVEAGKTTTYSMTVNLVSGTNQAVSLAVSGLPSGTTGSFSPSSGNPPFTSTLTITTSETAPTGTYTVTITGTGGGKTKSLSAQLTVAPSFDFTLLSSSTTFSLEQGGSVRSTITVTRTQGTARQLLLTISGLPAGATGSFSPESGTPSFTSALTITTAETTPRGTYTLTITAVEPVVPVGERGKLKTVQATLTIQPRFDFSISVLVPPGGLGVEAGKTATSSVSVNLVSGTSQPISLTVSGLPSGISGSFSPSSGNPPFTSTLTITTSSSASAGTYTLTISASGGGKTKIASALLIIQRPAPAPQPQQPAPAPPRVAESAKTLRLAHALDESNLTPYTHRTAEGYFLTTLIYDTIFWIDSQGNLQLWLIERFDMSPDGRELTLKLRGNIKWHDGKPLTAEDVKFTIEFMQKFQHPRFSPRLASLSNTIALDSTTLRLSLARPDSAFVTAALADIPILPKHLWGGITENPYQKPEVLRRFNVPELPAGSGPYTLVEYLPGQRYRLKANLDYFKGNPAVDEIIVSIIRDLSRDLSASSAALKAGEIDALSSRLTPELIKDLEQTPSIKLIRGRSLNPLQLQFNNERYPFSIKEYRKAIALSLDLDLNIKTATLGFAVKGSPGFLHPTWPGADTTLKYEFSVAKAKAILDGLGFRPGPDGIRITPNRTRLEFTLLTLSIPSHLESAKLISNALKEVGVSVSVKSVDNIAFGQKIAPKNFDMAMISFGSSVHRRGDALVQLFQSKSALNVGGYRNPTFDRLADQQLSEMDPTKRKEIGLTMQRIISEDFPTIILFYPDDIFAFRHEAYQGWVYVPASGTILDKLSFVVGRPLEPAPQPIPAPAAQPQQPAQQPQQAAPAPAQVQVPVAPQAPIAAPQLGPAPGLTPKAPSPQLAPPSGAFVETPVLLGAGAVVSVGILVGAVKLRARRRQLKLSLSSQSPAIVAPTRPVMPAEPEQAQARTPIAGSQPTSPQGPYIAQSTAAPHAELFREYLDVSLIGEGGFARVYKATRQTGGTVALKIPSIMDKQAGMAFLNEISAWRELNHPNIVRIHNFNIVPEPYLEMEYLEGGSLADWRRPLPFEEACSLMLRVAEGIAYAHSKGRSHRDLKPQNILMTRRGEPKITDWGLSRIAGAVTSASVRGYTPLYAAPEQIDPKLGKAGEKTDVYQFGVIFYELLTGQLPFRGEGISELYAKILNETPSPVSELHPEAKPADALIQMCLQKAKDARPSIVEVKNSLTRIIESNYQKSLTLSKSRGNTKRALYYCSELAVLAAKAGDAMQCAKYLADFQLYVGDDLKPDCKRILEEIQNCIQFGMPITEGLIGRMDMLIHRARME